MKKIAVLTSGGDAPGMNAAIRAVVRAGIYCGFSVYGVQNGLKGLIQGDWRAMSLGSVADIIHRGGTILHTSRSREFMQLEGRRQALERLQASGIENVIIIGGNGSLRAGHELSKLGINIIGIPATIDNDINGTQSIGFDTAVNTVLEAINRIRDTASSHGRVFIIEVMGRNCGEIALSAGVAGGAESILIPEIKTDINLVVEKILKGAQRGKLYNIIVVAEGAGPAERIRSLLSERLATDIKVIILGHVQRGGTPSAVDRLMASEMGKAAIDGIVAGKRNIVIAKLSTNNNIAIPIEHLWQEKLPLKRDMVKLAEILAT